MLEAPLFLLAVLATNVVIAELLARHTFLKHLGAALLVIVVTSITANLGLIPTYSDDVAVYRGIFDYVAPLAIFWLLLRVDLRDILEAGFPMIACFLLGALGTAIGVVVGMAAIDGEAVIGPSFFALGGMFTGTYTGGSANFNAVALEYHVNEEGVLFAAANVADSLMTTIWMSATLVLPGILKHFVPGRLGVAPAQVEPGDRTGVEDDTETLHPLDLALLTAVGCLTVWLAGVLKAQFDWNAMLFVTTVSLVLAQTPFGKRLRGSRLIGMFAVYLFLAVIGALCDVQALVSSGELGLWLLLFVAIAVGVHGLVVFGGAALLRISPDVAAVASQANIGGGTTALALARSLGRKDLVLPAILMGSLGTALGNVLGFAVADLLRP